MVFHLSEDDVKNLLTFDDCIQVIDDLFRSEAKGEAENRPTVEMFPPVGFFRLKTGALWADNTIGSGKEAWMQVQALARVSPLEHVRVYSRSPENRTKFAREMAERIGIDV